MSDIIIVAIISFLGVMFSALLSAGIAAYAAGKDIDVEKERQNSPNVYSEAAENLVIQYRIENERLVGMLHDTDARVTELTHAMKSMQIKHEHEINKLRSEYETKLRNVVAEYEAKLYTLEMKNKEALDKIKKLETDTGELKEKK